VEIRNTSNFILGDVLAKYLIFNYGTFCVDPSAENYDLP